VIDFPLSYVFLRLFLLGCASEGLYLLLARNLEPGVPFLLLWTGLFATYAFAMAVARKRSGASLALFVFLTSTLYRASLLLEAAHSETRAAPEAFLQTRSPFEAVLEEQPWKTELVSVGFDLAALAVLVAVLRASSLPAGLALVYGWNPLLVMESAASTRLECVPLFFLLLSFLLAQKKRRTASALAYGASLAGPPFFWVTLPLAARALGPRLALALLVGGCAWAPLAAATPIPDLLEWPPSTRVGGSLFPALEVLLRLFATRSPFAAFWICGGAWLFLAFARLVKSGGEPLRLPRESLVLLGGFLFLAPEVLPWSFLPIAGLSAFDDNPGWIAASATAPLTWLALGAGSWSFWLAFLQYFPVYASLLFVALGEKRARPRPTSRR
jgi:hypothetical protein